MLGTVPAETQLDVLDRRGPWYLVSRPDNTIAWDRGWIHSSYVDTSAVIRVNQQESPRPGLPNSVRGFVQAGAHWFTAADSFETVTGSSLGALYGGGAQIGIGSFLVQASVDRYKNTGQRVSVVNDQFFELNIPETVTVTPVQVTAGYRRPGPGTMVGYLGAGVGVMLFKEQSPIGPRSDDVNEQHVSYHVLGGVEWPLFSWLWVGGEGQWTYVPDALGARGVSALFEEDDLGGATLRLKLSFGF